jgi:hypothetical protein
MEVRVTTLWASTAYYRVSFTFIKNDFLNYLIKVDGPCIAKIMIRSL